ncbi:MAG: hypothetical protein JXD22_12040 [Sedimentisphaerales bacterium]|nr:hypothetical protein [Sedimentisphaerales bacterium]
MKEKDTVPFSIGNKLYFEIPVSKIHEYTLAENETLFYPSEDDHENKKSVMDIFDLTATAVYCLNEKVLHRKTLSYDQQQSLSVSVSRGPFYLHLDTSSSSLDLRVDGFICHQIDFKIVSGDPLEPFLNDSMNLLLRGNQFNFTVINNADEFCMSPLIFVRQVLDTSGKYDISIIPETEIDESLFMSAKNAKCILRVGNPDFGLLVSVLRGYASYMEAGEN